jgi:hypothetical protein
MKRPSNPAFRGALFCLSVWVMLGSVPAQDTESARFRIEVTDNQKLQRFDVKFISLDDRTLCVDVGNWPSEQGEIQGASQWVSVESRGKIYPAHDPDLIADCFGGADDCAIRVKPRGSLQGAIPYSHFGKAGDIASLPDKQLRFPITPFVCEKQ